MEKNKKSSIILALILLSFFILIFLIVALIFLKLDSDNNNSNQIQNIVSDEESSIPYEPNLIDVLKEHNTEFLSQDGNTVYVSFDKDLYSEDGKSNEAYFVDLIEDIEQFFEKTTFRLIDEEKKINILAQYIASEDTYKIIFNDIENFYKNTDGESYVEAENV